MATGNAIQSPFSSGGGSSSSGTSTVTLALMDATGTVNVSNATAPGAAGSVLTSSDATDAIWSTTTGTVGAAGFATNAGTATTSGFATNAGTSTTSAFATNAGTATTSGFATNAGTATISGTATIANALNAAAGTVNVSAATAPGASGSVLISSSANTATWGVVTAAAGAPPGGATGTGAGTGTVAGGGTTGVADLGPTFSVGANYISTGTAYTCRLYWIATGTINSASPGVGASLYWGGVGGVALVGTGFAPSSGPLHSTVIMDVDVYWESTSAAQVNMGTAVGTLVTGLTTSSGKTFTFGGSIAMSAGVGTATIQPLQAHIFQVH